MPLLGVSFDLACFYGVLSEELYFCTSHISCFYRYTNCWTKKK